eukprot:6251888-Pyramimonas_sp.AAC.1
MPTASASMTDWELRTASRPAQPETLEVMNTHWLNPRLRARPLRGVLLHGLKQVGEQGTTDLGPGGGRASLSTCTGACRWCGVAPIFFRRRPRPRGRPGL